MKYKDYDREAEENNCKHSIANVRNEQGVALVLALVMLVMITLLGFWVLSTSNTDIKIAGNARNFQTALYNADSGVAQVTNPNVLLTIADDLYGSNTSSIRTVVPMTVGNYTATVALMCNWSMPPGSSTTSNNNLSTGASTSTSSLQEMLLSVDARRAAASDSDAGTGTSGSGRTMARYLVVSSAGTALSNANVAVDVNVAQLISGGDWSSSPNPCITF